MVKANNGRHVFFNKFLVNQGGPAVYRKGAKRVQWVDNGTGKDVLCIVRVGACVNDNAKYGRGRPEGWTLLESFQHKYLHIKAMV